jgi:hypothetical protein
MDIDHVSDRAIHTLISSIFVFHDFYFIFVMESEDKYKTSGGNSLAVKRLQQLYQCR